MTIGCIDVPDVLCMVGNSMLPYLVIDKYCRIVYFCRDRFYCLCKNDSFCHKLLRV